MCRRIQDSYIHNIRLIRSQSYIEHEHGQLTCFLEFGRKTEIPGRNHASHKLYTESHPPQGEQTQDLLATQPLVKML